MPRVVSHSAGNAVVQCCFVVGGDGSGCCVILAKGCKPGPGTLAQCAIHTGQWATTTLSATYSSVHSHVRHSCGSCPEPVSVQIISCTTDSCLSNTADLAASTQAAWQTPFVPTVSAVSQQGMEMKYIKVNELLERCPRMVLQVEVRAAAVVAPPGSSITVNTSSARVFQQQHAQQRKLAGRQQPAQQRKLAGRQQPAQQRKLAGRQQPAQQLQQQARLPQPVPTNVTVVAPTRGMWGTASIAGASIHVALSAAGTFHKVSS